MGKFQFTLILVRIQIWSIWKFVSFFSKGYQLNYESQFFSNRNFFQIMKYNTCPWFINVWVIVFNVLKYTCSFVKLPQRGHKNLVFIFLFSLSQKIKPNNSNQKKGTHIYWWGHYVEEFVVALRVNTAKILLLATV